MTVKFFRSYVFPLMILFIIVLLVFEFYVFLSMNRDKRYTSERKSIQEYETALCSLSVPKSRHRPHKARCPSSGIVTAFGFGGLSNHMWQYANVLAASITTGLDCYLPICMKLFMSKVFDNLTIPLLSDVGHCFLPLPDSVSSIDDWTSPEQSIVLKGSNPCNDVVVKYLKLLQSHFVFNKGLRNFAVLHLLRAKGNKTSATYIGVHITNTDIVVNQEYDDVYPSVQFFVDAMNHFRKEYSNAVFVVIADKKTFWKSIFGEGDVFIVEEATLKPVGAALSVLSHCDHTILASDGFAVWGAILSGGKVIVSLCMSEDFNSIIQQYKTWNYLLNNTKSVNKFLERLF